MIVLRVLFWSLVSKARACIDLNSTADLFVDVSKSLEEVVSHEAWCDLIYTLLSPDLDFYNFLQLQS